MRRRAVDPTEVPDVVVLRLPLYVRALAQLQAAGGEVVSSQELGALLQMTPAQIRKDLSYFGRFGKQGRGYRVEFLHQELRQILRLDRQWLACLIGVGNLGQAIINYPGFAPEGFNIVAAFDNDPELIGTDVRGLKVRPMAEIGDAIGGGRISIGVVAVPASHAQPVIDQLVEAGVGGILNYAPVAPKVPRSVVIRNIDPVLSLQSMTFYLAGKSDRASVGA
jgi:redox-sensing transcriptional repressor